MISAFFPEDELEPSPSVQVPRQHTRPSPSSWLALHHRLALRHWCLRNRSAPGSCSGSTRYNRISFAVHRWVQKSPENMSWRIRHGRIGPALRTSRLKLVCCQAARTDRNLRCSAQLWWTGLVTRAYFLWGGAKPVANSIWFLPFPSLPPAELCNWDLKAEGWRVAEGGKKG